MKPSVDSLPDINECVALQESFCRDRERGLDLSDCEEEHELSNESSDKDSDDDDFSRHLDIEDIVGCKRLLLEAVFVPPDRRQKGCKAMVSHDGAARPDLSENLICNGLERGRNERRDTSIDATAQTSLNTEDGRRNTTWQLPLILDGEDSGEESSRDDSWSNEGRSNKEGNVDKLANCPEASTSEPSVRMHCLGAEEMEKLLLDAGLLPVEGCLDGEDSGEESSEDDSWSNEGCSNKEDKAAKLANCPEAPTSESSMRMHCLGEKEMGKLLLDAGLVPAEGCLDGEDSGEESSEDDSWSNEGSSNKEDHVDKLANCPETPASESSMRMHCLGEKEMDKLLLDAGFVLAEGCLDAEDSEEEFSNGTEISFTRVNCLSEEEMNNLLFDTGFVPTKLCLDPACSEDSWSSESSLELEDSEGESADSAEACETQFSLKAPCLGGEDMDKLLIDAGFVPNGRWPTAPTQPLSYRRPVRRYKV
jgi:hypothetical protein